MPDFSTNAMIPLSTVTPDSMEEDIPVEFSHGLEYSKMHNMDEDLSLLLAAQLNIGNPSAALVPNQISYSASQHYHHSAHLTTPSETQRDLHTLDTAAAATEIAAIRIVLARYGVDPNSLSPEMLSLFRSASAAEQIHLMNIWRFQNLDQSSDLVLSRVGPLQTALSESDLVRVRRAMEEQRYQTDQFPTSALDIIQSSEGIADRTTEASLADNQFPNQIPHQADQAQSAEPYMIAGYEEKLRSIREGLGQYNQAGFSHFGSAVGPNTWPGKPVHNPACEEATRDNLAMSF